MQACENVNTWPVLAAPGDDAVLGAAYMLPDHPQVAPQSKVNLFDNTEIEEALLLHVHALSDEERAAIDRQDPAVREMVERAEATTPEEILDLHGLMQPSRGPTRSAFPESGVSPEWTEPERRRREPSGGPPAAAGPRRHRRRGRARVDGGRSGAAARCSCGPAPTAIPTTG